MFYIYIYIYKLLVSGTVYLINAPRKTNMVQQLKRENYSIVNNFTYTDQSLDLITCYCNSFLTFTPCFS